MWNYSPDVISSGWQEVVPELLAKAGFAGPYSVEPLSGGGDPYAQPTPASPTTARPPSGPITSLTEEIAGNLNPAPPQTTEPTTDEASYEPVQQPRGN